MKLPGIRAQEAPNSGRLGESSRPLMKERATACLQAVLLLLGKSTACLQAVAHIVDDLAVFQRVASLWQRIC